MGDQKGRAFMKNYNAKTIRNVALTGHAGSGKTTLTEAMYYLAYQADRLGKVADGNTVSDFDPEEIRRQVSVSTSLVPVEWKNTNELIHPDSKYYCPYAVGLKTGQTPNAGACLLSAFEMYGYQWIIGVFGCPEEFDRFDDTIQLFNETIGLG